MLYLIYLGASLCLVASWVFMAAAGLSSARENSTKATWTLVLVGLLFALCDKILMVWGLAWR